MAANPRNKTTLATLLLLTPIVIGTSSVHLLAEAVIDISSHPTHRALLRHLRSGTLLSFGTNGSFTYRPNTGFKRD